MTENKKIVALGCSWTAKYYEDVDPWPSMIAKRTGHKVYNYGFSGTGNKFSFDNFIRHLRKVGTPDSVYWLISEFDRIDIIEPHNQHSVFSFKPIIQNSKPNFLEAASERYKYLHPNISDDHFNNWYRGLKSDVQISKILFNTIDYQLIIDYNLDLLYKIQEICKFYNIELKIIAGLRPIEAFYIDNLSTEQVASMILKSKITKKLDLNNMMGFPFYKVAGGQVCNSIHHWCKNYGYGNDNHPHEAGANLIADFFLGEKNILDYK